ncbi:hypothetical protein RHGRI_027904 [Rhododendron griersonianum]|uniref:Uncharacterized protein n=1 Tax=Rhododendron griersonianum TaxID=479676 RepID=A0AAV6J1R7_9ERIC|nr:hypothetical protein RHGRI_027904 [Rhododendron griersonianum]
MDEASPWLFIPRVCGGGRLKNQSFINGSETPSFEWKVKMEDQVLILSDLLGVCLIALGANDVGGKTLGFVDLFSM